MERHCVYVNVDGKWKTADCNQNKSSICMKSTGRDHVKQLEHRFNINTISYMKYTDCRLSPLYFVLNVTVFFLYNTVK